MQLAATSNFGSFNVRNDKFLLVAQATQANYNVEHENFETTIQMIQRSISAHH
jgi:hypothetical protein